MVETFETHGPVRGYTGTLLHWPSIIAGAFVALSLFVVTVVLGRAVNMDFTYWRSAGTRSEMVPLICGGVAALICFGIGGWVAARNAAAFGRGSAMLNGFLVWAVVVPVFVAGLSLGIGAREIKSAVTDGAVQAGARIEPSGAPSTAAPADQPTTHPQQTAWWLLCLLGLGLLGAAGMSSIAVAGRSRRADRTVTTP